MQREGRALPRTQRSLLDSGKWHRREDEEPLVSPSVKDTDTAKRRRFLGLVIKCVRSRGKPLMRMNRVFLLVKLPRSLAGGQPVHQNCRYFMANPSPLGSNNDGSSNIWILSGEQAAFNKIQIVNVSIFTAT